MKTLKQFLLLAIFVGTALQPLQAQDKMKAAKEKMEHQKDMHKEKMQEKRGQMQEKQEEKRKEMEESVKKLEKNMPK